MFNNTICGVTQLESDYLVLHTHESVRYLKTGDSLTNHINWQDMSPLY